MCATAVDNVKRGPSTLGLSHQLILIESEAPLVLRVLQESVFRTRLI